MRKLYPIQRLSQLLGQLYIASCVVTYHEEAVSNPEAVPVVGAASKQW
jgi:hypothetical protein